MKPKKSNQGAKSTLQNHLRRQTVSDAREKQRPPPNHLVESKKLLTHSPIARQTNKAHTCSGCKKLIKREKYLLSACDKFWHESCLKCDQCHAKLGELGSSLYIKSDLILCRQDFLDLFGPSCVCAACDKVIRASEMVMRAKENVYHLECFACQLCSQSFCVGDQFYLLENKVICQYDYEDIQRSVQMSSFDSPPQCSDSFIQRTTSDHLDQQQEQHQPVCVLQELTRAPPLVSTSTSAIALDEKEDDTSDGAQVELDEPDAEDNSTRRASSASDIVATDDGPE